MKLHVVYQNNHIDTVHDACKLCYKGKHAETLEGKLKYIEDKVKHQHESVLEHSNVIMLFNDIDNYNVATMMNLVEFMTAAPELNFAITNDATSPASLVIGGSIRAYKNIFRNIKNSKNVFANMLLNEGLIMIPKAYFHDFISAGIMEPHRFKDDECIYDEITNHNSIEREYYDFINIDPIDEILVKINAIIGETAFTLDDMLPMCTASVFFTRISRIISQQITRHRNAISQQSQRYVDETGCEVVNPLEFKDYMDPDTKFKTGFGEVTLDELGAIMSEVYGSLRAGGLKKEDGRYYLPQNVLTSLYMTFTFKKLIHFFEVRTGSHAQAEIRSMASNMLDDFMEVFGLIFNNDIFKYLIPKYMLTETDSVEAIAACEEIID